MPAIPDAVTDAVADLIDREARKQRARKLPADAAFAAAVSIVTNALVGLRDAEAIDALTREVRWLRKLHTEGITAA